ncbi:MAG: chloride channel protein [Planctomycetota bacterium]|nr:chloride channel protein [Planctomycetota bacterium]
MIGSTLIRSISTRIGLDRDWYLILLAVIIGLVMGTAALVFIMPITWLETYFEHFDDNKLEWTSWVVLVLPIGGAVLTGITLWAMPIKLRGHGVSICMYSVSREQGRLPILLMVRQWIGSTFTIGSGGSAGPEGPIVTIGATVGSNLGKLLKADAQNTSTLLGCGAAAGLASVFNAPMAGIFFVLEVILRDFSLRTFTPIVVAAVISAATTQTILGTNEPLFGVGPEIFNTTSNHFTVLQVPEFMVLGIVCGMVASFFGLSLRTIERFFRLLRSPKILKPSLGAALLVVLGIIWFQVGTNIFVDEDHWRAPAFYGNGYMLIKTLLQPDFYVQETGGMIMLILALLVLLKIIATALTLGSGGAGGLFAPSLVLGALTGSLFGGMLEYMGFLGDANPAQFALVGMAAVVAATTHAPLTGMILVYEITQNYELILPLMLTAVIATIVSRIVNRESIYSADLRAMGVKIGTMSDLTLLRRMSVRDVPMIPPVLVQETENGQRLLELSERFSVNDFVVVDDDDRYIGLVTGNDLSQALLYREAIPLLQVGEIERVDLPTVVQDETLDQVLNKFSAHDVQSLAVINSSTQEVVGLITRTRLMREYQRELEKD